MIPTYHNAFAPIWLDIPGDGSASVVIISGEQSIALEVEILSNQNTVDIQKYVQALMGDKQFVRYNIKINDVQMPDTYLATRSAQQAGEPNDISDRANRILTDRKKLTVYDGFPCEISIFQNEPDAKIINTPVTCDDKAITTIIYLASYGGKICQKVIELFVSASYGNPVCQKIDQTITYTDAEWTEPVCQKYDDSVSYTEAEWTNPICQQVSDVILLSINLAKTGGFTTPNMFTIKWKYSEDVPQLFQTNIRLNSDVRVQNGSFAQLVNINIDFTATGTMGSATQTVNYDTLLGVLSCYRLTQKSGKNDTKGDKKQEKLLSVQYLL
jgi:hypothetical protein